MIFFPRILSVSKTFHSPTDCFAQSLTISAGSADGYPQVINTQEAASTLVLKEVPERSQFPGSF